MLRPVTPLPITVAPGFETMAEDILEHGGSEPVVWIPAGGDEVPLRGLVREKSQALKAYGSTTWMPVQSVRLDAAKVQGILPGDVLRLRGRAYKAAPGGIHPDGVCMVSVDLQEPK